MKHTIITIILASTISLNAQIAISEILYAQPSWDTDFQYIELHNYSDNTINLSGWALAGDINLITLPNIDLPAGEHYVFCSDILALLSLGVVMDIAQWAQGEQISEDPVFILTDPDGKEVVNIAYDKNLNWPVPEKGTSIELCDPTINNNEGLNWALSENVISSNNKELIGTPGDENTCTKVQTPSIDIVKSNLVKLYPLPCHSILNMDYTQPIESSTIYDITGRIRIQANDTNSINVSDLEAGIYNISISTNGITTFEKFIKH